MNAALHLLVVALAAAKSLAAPAPETKPKPKPQPQPAASCTFSGPNGAAEAMKAQSSCSTLVLSSLAVPAGTTLDLSRLADKTTVIFQGNTTWGYKEWAGPLLQIKGRGITVQGAPNSVLDAGGGRWWDGRGSYRGKKKPKFLAAHGLTGGSVMENVQILNTPVQAVSIDHCDGLTITNMVIDNQAGDGHGANNTDGFDIGDSSNVVITGARVYNQDDCVAVNSGTAITMQECLCSGGHGLSIGAVGGRDDNTVDTVTFANCRVLDSDHGVRVKAQARATGAIRGVTYRQIQLRNIRRYGILVEQNYDGGDLHGDPTAGLPITDLTLAGIDGAGAVAAAGYNVAIACGNGSCSAWNWSDVNVSGGKTYACLNAPAGVTC